MYFGAWVTLEDDDENIKTFRLVGPDEFDPAKQWISIDSPVARALIGKKWMMKLACKRQVASLITAYYLSNIIRNKINK